MLPSRELAEIAVKALDSKKGKEIRLIRIDKITTLAEYFVICTAVLFGSFRAFRCTHGA